jgi:Fe-Mn family superoxide dismutase
VKRLNLIEEKLAELDYASVPVFVMNGLKREQLIAMNSMILHELFFDGLGDQSEPGVALCDADLASCFRLLAQDRARLIAEGALVDDPSGDPK